MGLKRPRLGAPVVRPTASVIWAAPTGVCSTGRDTMRLSVVSSLQKPPDLGPFFYDLTRAKSAKELK